MMARCLPRTSVVIALLIALSLKGEAKKIKVKALTLTGKSLPLLVEHDATVRDLKVINSQD